MSDRVNAVLSVGIGVLTTLLIAVVMDVEWWFALLVAAITLGVLMLLGRWNDARERRKTARNRPS